jgi:membrane-associated phospholipid phosphatase
MMTPTAAEVGSGVGERFVNAGVVYSQTLLANLFFNTVIKFSIRRPRPYTYAKTDDCGFRVDASDANLSFYSGHSSAAFAAATAGSYLFAEGSNDRESRWVIWGTEFALAAGVANLRVRAGKHYYSDVVVGALLGIGFGIAGPVLHGADRRPAASELVAASYGVLFGVLASQFIPLRSSLPLTTGKRDWLLLPLTMPGSVGAQAITTL